MVATKPVTTEVEQCVTAAGYLDNRAIPAAGTTSHECLKTGDYLDDPTVPGEGATATTGAAPSMTAPDPTPAFPSVLETPDVDSRDYAYDSLNRLIGSETSKGNTAEYAYDPAGNRVEATTKTGAGTTDVTASFNEANQLTGSTGNGAASSYGYDGNGNRTTQNENGVTTDFTYQTDNRLTGVTRDGRSSAYAYDGLGRQLNTTETSSLGSQTTKSVWDGTSIVQQSNPASGTSTLLRDAFGEVALQTADGKDASWALLDGLGTTAAQAVGGAVTQLSTFDDWGTQTFDTIGWNSTVNYTGETTDPGYGLNNYYSRSYDPTTGSWMSQDSWRGLLAEPQSMSRYAYVDNGPTTRQDLLGYCYADNSGAYLYGGPCAPKPTPVNSIPSLRVMEIYASEDSPGAHTEEWEPQIYSYDPDGDLQSIPARHVQGYDEDFPGYDPAASSCTAGEVRGRSWYVPCGSGAGEDQIIDCINNEIQAQVCWGALDVLILILTRKASGRAGGITSGIDDLLPPGMIKAPAAGEVAAAVKPSAETPKLVNLIDNIYKGTANSTRTGDGTLMAALKEEFITGEMVGGRFHTDKAQQTINGLNNFLRQNPNASPYERELANNLIDQIVNAMHGVY